MSKLTPNLEVLFEQDYSAAKFEDGSVVKFTRLERRALEFFNKSAGRILTRGQILDAVSDPGSEKSDRSTDFLINRIRGKLGDEAHSPRFIATQYGEGYVWLYSPQRVTSDFSDTFAVIGPFKGVQSLAGEEGCAMEFAKLLQADFRKALRPDQRVEIAPDLTMAQRASGPSISVQLGFFRDRTSAECVVTTRGGNGDRIIDLQKFELTDGPGQFALLSDKARAIAQRAITGNWRDVASSAAVTKPLPVAIAEGVRLREPGWSWTETDRVLRQLRAEHPEDPAIKMMWATHLHAKYIKHGTKLFRTGTDTCAAISEDRILAPGTEIGLTFDESQAHIFPHEEIASVPH